MNRSNTLPDFIHVANIKDLFWNNNSDLYPTCVPTGYRRITNTRPIFISPYIGTCVLDGEFNHCLYNGEYYFLSKLEILDVVKGRYKYQLDYDVMINFMSKETNVRGTLTKTNRGEILEGCLQTAVPVLADPISKRVYGKSKTKKEWQEKLDVKFFDINEFSSGKLFNQWVNTDRFASFQITQEDYVEFINRVENSLIGRGTKDKEWLTRSISGTWNNFAHQDPLFILDSITPEWRISQWKVYLLTGLVKYAHNLRVSVDERKKLTITKLTQIEGHTKTNSYVLGFRDKGLGTEIISEVYLETLDLTNLIDIIPVDSKTLNPLTPNKKPTQNILVPRKEYKEHKKICALLRNPYLPIGNNTSIEGCINPGDNDLYNYCEIGKLAGNNVPQKIVTKDDRTAYLWYLNKNNLALIDQVQDGFKQLGCNLGVSIYDDVYSRWGFFSTDYRNIPPIGFLIYQRQQNYDLWDDIECLYEGEAKVRVRVGLNKLAIEDRYVKQANKFWWNDADSELLNLWGDSVISKIILDLDQFNWLSIAPSNKGYWYKYHWGDYWGYKKFYPDAGNRQLGYPSVLNRSNIKWKGQTISNPYAYADPDDQLPGWLKQREQLLDYISIYKELNLGISFKRGDILTTSLEHGFYDLTKFTKFLIPYDITPAEWNQWRERDFKQVLTIKNDTIKGYVDELSTWSIIGSTGTIMAGLLAPFTGGASLIALLPTATLSIYGAVSANDIRDLDVYQQSTVINTLPYSNPEYIKPSKYFEDGTIIFYLYRGKYKIGVYRTKEENIQLESGDINLVKTVNGKAYEQFYVMFIRELGELNFKHEQVINENLRSTIIQYGLGSPNWDTLEPQDKVFHYDADELKVGTHTFDLKGTDWYLIIHNGEYNLLPKDNNIFRSTEDEDERIDIRDDNVSTFSKINQKATLNYYGQIFNLNTKFNFDDDFKYVVKPLILDPKFEDKGMEYKWLQVNEPSDNIDALITLPRKETGAADKVDPAQILMLKERLLQQTMNYEQDKYANELMLSTKRLGMARQREDLNAKWYNSILGATIKGIGTIASLGTSTSGGMNVAKAALGAVGTTAMSSDIQYLIRYPKLMKRIDEDEEGLLLSNSQQLYQRRQNYEHDFKFQTLKLNQMAGSYQKPAITNRDAQEKYNKVRNVGDVTVEILLPSEAQQIQINHIYNTFGCECISDHFETEPLFIRNNMEPGLYKFSKISKGGIDSPITDSTLRDIFRQILENGCKFEQCDIEVETWEEEPLHVALPKQPKVIFNPATIKDWAIEKWDFYRINTPTKEILDALKNVPHYGLTDNEWELHKDKFKDIEGEDLLDLITKVIRSRDTGETIIVAPKKDVDTEKEALNETIASLRAQITKLEKDIKSNTDLCTAEKERLVEDKQNIETQLVECRKEREKLNRDKQSYENQIAQLQTSINNLTQEKQQVETNLNECQNQLREAQQSQSSTDRTNTQRIRELERQVEQLNRTKTQNETRLNNLNTQLTRVNNDLNKKKSDLTTCKNNLNSKTSEANRLNRELTQKNKEIERLEQGAGGYAQQLNSLHNQLNQKEQEITTLTQNLDNATQQITSKDQEINNQRDQISTLQRNVSEQQQQIDAKDKQLSDKDIQLSNKDKEISAKEQQLQSERQSHKEDKEELEQKLNDERRKYLDERDKLNADLKTLEGVRKDLERITTEKQQLQGDYESKVRELEECKSKPTIPLPKPKQPMDCNLMLRLMGDKYEYDLKERDNGWNAFMDLVFEIAANLQVEGKTDVDQQLSSNTDMRPILQKLEEVKNVPIIDQAITLTQKSKWNDYLNWIVNGGNKPSNISSIEADFDRIKQSSTPTVVNGLKSILDELNYLVYKTKDKLSTQIEEDTNIQFFLRHIYPAGILDDYEKVFGEPNQKPQSYEIAVIRKKYAEEVKCVDNGSADPYEILSRYSKSVPKDFQDISIWGVGVNGDQPIKPQVKPSPAVPPKDPLTIRFAHSLDEAKYSGIPLKDMNLSDVWSHPILVYEDANKSTYLDNSTQPFYRNISLNSKPNITKAIQFYNWVYTRNVPALQGDRKLIWFKWKDSTTGYRDTNNQDQYGNYLVSRTMNIWTADSIYRQLLKDRGAKMNIPKSILQGIKDGTKTLKLRLKDFMGVYTPGIRQEIEIVTFGNGNNELLWPEDKIEELLKRLFALHYLSVIPKHYEPTHDTDNYNVYEFRLGKFHPGNPSIGPNINATTTLNRINADIATMVNNDVIDLDLGWQFNLMIGRAYDIDGQGHSLPDHVPKTHQSVGFITLYYYLWKDSKFGTARYNVGTGGATLEGYNNRQGLVSMFEDMNTIKRTKGKR